jgi:ubiquinone/menaquinone biosynthesis C-methylase UbiE
MKNAHKAIILFSIVLFAFTADTYCQKSNVVVEGWEHSMNRRKPPMKVMDAIGLKPGMVIGDIGAGTGRMAVWFADRVGPEGKVYANDIDKNALDHLRRRCQRHDIKNISIILGEVEDPRLPTKSLDIAFMINTYHHLEKPVALVRNTLPSLKPDGILAIVERDPEKSGASEVSSTPKKDMLTQLDEAGFEIIRIEDFLKEDYIYICKPKSKIKDQNGK